MKEKSIETQRSVVAWESWGGSGTDGKQHEGSFWKCGNSLKLGCGDDCIVL